MAARLLLGLALLNLVFLFAEIAMNRAGRRLALREHAVTLYESRSPSGSSSS
jgi:hypothetical protein